MNSAYIASVINSTLRSTTPILLAALGCAMCSQVGVFNVALEAQMLIACFTSIAVDYYTSSVLLSVLAGVLSGAVVGAVVAILQVKYKAADMVVGTALKFLPVWLASHGAMMSPINAEVPAPVRMIRRFSLRSNGSRKLLSAERSASMLVSERIHARG